MEGKTTNLEERAWWFWVDEGVGELLKQSVAMVSEVPEWSDKYHDYSFVVFPAAKAYEGFLKKLFFEMGFINSEQYTGKRFRIGKALNPFLDRELRATESVYDRVIRYCGGKELADKLWDAWIHCRNVLFHWFPDERNAITFEEAKKRIWEIMAAMDAAFADCELPKK